MSKTIKTKARNIWARKVHEMEDKDKIEELVTAGLSHIKNIDLLMLAEIEKEMDEQDVEKKKKRAEQTRAGRERMLECKRQKKERLEQADKFKEELNKL